VSAASEIRRWSRREWPRRKNDSHIGFPESRERSRSKEGGNERSPGGRKLPNARAWGSSQQDRSLRPPFWRTPAPRSRLRTRNQSAFRAASEAARQRRESERSLRGFIRRGNERPHRSTAAEQGIANARARAAHSGRNSAEFRRPGARVLPDFASTAHSGRRSDERRHPVRGSERAINALSEPRAKRRASAAGASGPCADPSAVGTTGPTAALVALPEQGIRNPRSQTAHSGRRSDERRRPVRGSERAVNALSEPRAKRRASAARASGRTADTGCLGRAGNWKRSGTNRSLWPEFRRIPAPRRAGLA